MTRVVDIWRYTNPESPLPVWLEGIARRSETEPVVILLPCGDEVEHGDWIAHTEGGRFIRLSRYGFEVVER